MEGVAVPLSHFQVQESESNGHWFINKIRNRKYLIYLGQFLRFVCIKCIFWVCIFDLTPNSSIVTGNLVLVRNSYFCVRDAFKKKNYIDRETVPIPSYPPTIEAVSEYLDREYW